MSSHTSTSKKLLTLRRKRKKMEARLVYEIRHVACRQSKNGRLASYNTHKEFVRAMLREFLTEGLTVFGTWNDFIMEAKRKADVGF